MPVMDGYVATKLIRTWESEQKREPVPVFALTAHAMSGDADKSIQAGCNGHLTKPVRKAKLMDVVRRYVHDYNTSVGTVNTKSERKNGDHARFGGDDKDELMFHDSINHSTLDLLTQEMDNGVEYVLTTFLHNCPQLISAISKAITNNDAKDLSRTAHRLKGSSATIGAERLSALCSDFEQYGKDSELSKAASLLQTLEEEGQRVEKALIDELSVH